MTKPRDGFLLLLEEVLFCSCSGKKEELTRGFFFCSVCLLHVKGEGYSSFMHELIILLASLDVGNNGKIVADSAHEFFILMNCRRGEYGRGLSLLVFGLSFTLSDTLMSSLCYFTVTEEYGQYFSCSWDCDARSISFDDGMLGTWPKRTAPDESEKNQLSINSFGIVFVICRDWKILSCKHWAKNGLASTNGNWPEARS